VGQTIVVDGGLTLMGAYQRTRNEG
jgi:hypothetical protein